MPGINRSEKLARTIAVCGKGGVGKTAVSAAIVSILAADKSRRILAVDADPASGLGYALGFRESITVDSIRSALIDRISREGAAGGAEISALLEYQVFEALEERDNIAFLAIGRPEGEGCYCRVNSLLRDVIEKTAASFDFVVIDGEAGIEQINRRVFRSVSHLLLVSDPSARGLRVAGTIKNVSSGLLCSPEVGLALNMVKGEISDLLLPDSIPLLGLIPDDGVIRDAGIYDKVFAELPGCPAIRAIRRIVNDLGLI